MRGAGDSLSRLHSSVKVDVPNPRWARSAQWFDKRSSPIDTVEIAIDAHNRDVVLNRRCRLALVAHAIQSAPNVIPIDFTPRTGSVLCGRPRMLYSDGARDPRHIA
jgi:hypothetical protein